MASGYLHVSPQNSKVEIDNSGILIRFNTPISPTSFTKSVLLDYGEISNSVYFMTPTVLNFTDNDVYEMECGGTSYNVGIYINPNSGKAEGIVIVAK